MILQFPPQTFRTNVLELPGISKAEVSAELEFPFTVLSFSFWPGTIFETFKSCSSVSLLSVKREVIIFKKSSGLGINLYIGRFCIAFGLFFKASPGAQLFI